MEKIKEVLSEHFREVIIAAVAAILILIALMMLLVTHSGADSQQPQLQNEMSSQTFSGESSAESMATSGSQVASSQSVYVDVKGAVRNPGLKKMSGDMRIIDVVQEAGGFTKNADQRQVNLAQRVTDQQVVYIPRHGEKSPQGSTGTMGTGAATAQQGSQSAPEVDLNNADLNQLQQLDGVGEKKAEKIIQYREQNGSFKSVDDLKNVSGFGDKTLERLKPQLRV